MGKELEFFILLVERYAQHKNLSTADVIRQWDAHGITDQIYDSYFEYHQERLENAFDDIDRMLAS